MLICSGRCYERPSDVLAQKVSALVSSDSAVRELFLLNTFVSSDPTDRVALIHATLPKAIKADAILKVRTCGGLNLWITRFLLVSGI